MTSPDCAPRDVSPAESRPTLASRIGAVARFGRIRRVLADERGVAAVEFALILPVMLTLYLGSIEVSQALSIDRKVVLLSRTLADLTAQTSSVKASSLDNIAAAAAAVMAPVSAGSARIRITSIAISADKATACWSYHKNWAARARGYEYNATQVPPALRSEVGSSLILAEVEYPYTPNVGSVLTGTVTLAERLFIRPRLTKFVEHSEATNKGVPLADGAPCLAS